MEGVIETVLPLIIKDNCYENLLLLFTQQYFQYTFQHVFLMGQLRAEQHVASCTNEYDT